MRKLRTETVEYGPTTGQEHSCWASSLQYRKCSLARLCCLVSFPFLPSNSLYPFAPSPKVHIVHHREIGAEMGKSSSTMVCSLCLFQGHVVSPWAPLPLWGICSFLLPTNWPLRFVHLPISGLTQCQSCSHRSQSSSALTGHPNTTCPLARSSAASNDTCAMTGSGYYHTSLCYPPAPVIPFALKWWGSEEQRGDLKKKKKLSQR